MHAEQRMLGERVYEAHLAPVVQMPRNPRNHWHGDARLVGELLEGSQRVGGIQEAEQYRECCRRLIALAGPLGSSCLMTLD